MGSTWRPAAESLAHNRLLKSLQVDRHRETALASALANGEPDAFDRFVEHFRTRLFRYSRLVCGQREDAEEVAQEAFLKAFVNFGKLRDPERIRPWMFRIARNACLMKRRKSLFAPEREISLDANKVIEIADWSALPEDLALSRELREELSRAIAGLPDSYRAVVLLRDVEELSTEHTAKILDLGVDVVKTRLHRGRLAIRQKLNCYLSPEARCIRPRDP